MWREIKFLVAKEFRLEWRRRYAFSGAVVYVLSTVFVCYLSFKRVPNVPTWNALLWIILLFVGVNAVAKSFLQESRGQWLYQYSLCSPQAIILAKILYNAGLVTVLALTCLGCYTLLVGNPIQDLGQFLLAVVLGGIGFSSTLTLISAIAAKTDNNPSLMAILSFPLILPLLLTLIAFSKNAVDGLPWSVNAKYIGALGGINLVVLALSYLLFPYLWRD